MMFIRHCDQSKPCPREDGLVAVKEEKMFPCNTQPCPGSSVFSYVYHCLAFKKRHILYDIIIKNSFYLEDCPAAPWKDWSISEGLVKRTIETIEEEGKPCPPLLKTKDCSSQKCPSKKFVPL